MNLKNTNHNYNASLNENDYHTTTVWKEINFTT